MALADSIRSVRKKLGLTQEQFAAELGIKRSLIGAYEEGRAEPRLEMLSKMARLGEISLETILNGIKDRSNVGLVSRSPQKIQLVPIKAAAGYLKGYADPDVLEELPHLSLPILGKGDFRAFEIEGDSMLPLPSGSVVIGQRLESLSDLKSGEAYIFITRRDGIVYKRVQKRPENAETINLESDNPLFKSYRMELQDIIEVWVSKAFIILKSSS